MHYDLQAEMKPSLLGWLRSCCLSQQRQPANKNNHQQGCITDSNALGLKKCQRQQCGQGQGDSRGSRRGHKRALVLSLSWAGVWLLSYFPSLCLWPQLLLISCYNWNKITLSSYTWKCFSNPVNDTLLSETPVWGSCVSSQWAIMV